MGWLALAGAGLGAIGQLEEGNAAKEIGDYQASILRSNAAISQQQSDDAIERGKVSIRRNQTQVAQMIGRQRTLLAASGVLVDSGSASDLVSDTVYVGEQQERDLRVNAEREALAYHVQALNQLADAKLQQLAGKKQQKASLLKAGSTLLGAGARTYSFAS